MTLIPPVVDAAPSQRAAPAKPWRALRVVVRSVLGLVVLAWSLLLIGWLTLHWGILPRIEQWRPQIEARASAALGVPVRIGAIEIRSGSWVPAFELRDVTLLDGEQRVALQLPRVAAAISPKSLLSFQLRFDQLLIEGARLEVRCDALGRIFVAGLELGGAGGDATPLRDWFFEQHEFVIRGGSLRWIDERRPAPPLTLTQVELAVRNGVLQHEVRLDATPDIAWGERFSLRGRFTQPLLARAGDWQRWSGNAFVDLPRVDVRELRQHVSLPFELSEGDGAVRAWLELAAGRPRAATVDLALRAVSLRLARTVEPLAFEQIEGRLLVQHSEAQTSIAAQRFGFLTGDGLRWPAGDAALAWQQRDGGPVTGGEFSAQRLDLALMAQVATRIPLGEALRELLGELSPQGTVSDLTASWQGPLDAPKRYQAKALFSGLTLAASAASAPTAIGRPGLTNATLQVSASEAGGTAQLGINGGTLSLPGVFEQPLVALDNLSAQLQWKIEAAKAGTQPPRISLQVKEARFANADVQGDFTGTWSTGAGEGFARSGRFPGLLELNGRVGKAAARRVARYLPLGIPVDARRYVERSVQGGTLQAASFRVKGDLWDFPFYTAKSAREGEFRIAGKLEDLTFAYVPNEPATASAPAVTSPWPGFTGLSGELIIDRATLGIRNARAQLGAVQLAPVQADIRDLADAPVLAVEGVARGPLTQMLRFVDTTPVAGWTSHALARATGTGTAELKLALNMPLSDLGATKVKGSLALPGNDVRITPDTPLLAAAKGRIDFSQDGLSVVGATARVFGGDLAFEGGHQTDGAMRFNGQGTIAAEGLRRASELGAVSRLSGALSGQAAYRLSLGFVQGHAEVNLTSNLMGLAIDLPAPLRKAAETPLALRYQSQIAADSLQAGQNLRDNVRLELGPVLQAQYTRDLAGETPRVLRGGIGVFEPAPTPGAGVVASINLPVLSVDAWEAALARWWPAAGNAGPGSAAPPSASEAAGFVPYAPHQIALQVQALQAGSRQFNRVVAGLSQDAGLWRTNVDAEQLNGYVEYRPARPGAAQVAGRVYARLARLSLPKGDLDQVESLLDRQQPTTVPALDIVIDDFELRGKRLGRLEIEAINRADARAPDGREALREWRLTKFNLVAPEAQLSGSGQWQEVGGTYMTLPGAAATARRRAVLDFKLDVSNGGAFLERLGMGQAIRGGKGQLAGQLSWLGSPLSLDYASLSGNVGVNMDAGQFLKAEPGAARLLGVLSLQALPRRLLLDFRDVFEEGFAFDSVSGDLRIAQGVAHTNNLRMRGVQAVVLMEGQADLARETQDLRVIVVPEINAGTAALAYAAINPVVGLGTFLAQALLRRPFIAANTREFHVTGPWADPKVDKVERRLTDAVPDVDAPLPAPAAGASAARNGQ
jgi:uncharacterized protein (TIGR02099 family)